MLGWLPGGIEVDLETADAIDSLRQDIGQRVTGIGQRITAVEDALRGEIRELREEMRGEMREMREELMRHALVLTDSVRDDIRIVADGLATVNAKLDALRR
jgi:hypothetical protein